jgi:formylglycine-generating enzyme required for sulfatase activity/tRNA A-37 threonylcarbamoyl transferase component Bud32
MMTGLVGRTLGQYEIIEEVGHGGMADVYRAVQPSIGREVAVKVLPAHFLQDRTFLERFMREVKVIAQLQHPRILPVYDFGEQGGLPFIVMAYMPGGTLADRIHEAEGGLPLDAAAHYVGQIAEALDYAHGEGVIHRDFKPSNALLDKQDNIYLADFGIAKVTEATAQLTGSGIIGTPAYMAPEMTERGGVTSLIDVYALGVTLYQMLTAQLPFEADTPMGTALAHVTRPIPDARRLRPDLSDTVQAIIEKALAKDPIYRYPSAGEMAADLSAAAFPDIRSPAREAAVPTPPGVLAMDVAEVAAAGGVYETEAVKAQKPVPAALPARRRLPAWVWIGGAVAGVALLISVLALAGVFGGGAPAEEAPMETGASVAVEETEEVPGSEPEPRNADWSPVIQDFDGIEMALVPAGCFMMGSSEEEIDYALDLCETYSGGCVRTWFEREMPQHEVCFEEPFWIDVYEVTNAQYGSSGEWPGDNRPREEITWFEAADYCESRGARLPTEAEWEYAARGPDGLVFPWGNEFVAHNVVYYGNSGSQTASVGSRPGGVSWVGAHDLSGNVWEWVADWYGTYPSGAQVNPSGPDSGSVHVMRGGSWSALQGFNLRAADRSWDYPGYPINTLGFRCALSQ